MRRVLRAERIDSSSWRGESREVLLGGRANEGD